jgi:Ca2+-dependent lipid-binding protein
MIIRDVPKSGPSTKDVGVIDESSFQIVHIDKIITLRAPSPSEKKQWLNVVESCIEDAEKKLTQDEVNIPHKMKSLVDRPIIGTLEVKLLETKKLACSDRIRKFIFLKSGIVEIFLKIIFLKNIGIKPAVFCTVTVDQQSLKSKSSQSWPPKWDQELMFSIFSLDKSLKMTLYNYDRYSKDEYIGEASIQLDFLEYYNGKETEKISLELKDVKHGFMVVQLAYKPM